MAQKQYSGYIIRCLNYDFEENDSKYPDGSITDLGEIPSLSQLDFVNEKLKDEIPDFFNVYKLKSTSGKVGYYAKISTDDDKNFEKKKPKPLKFVKRSTKRSTKKSAKKSAKSKRNAKKSVNKSAKRKSSKRSQ